MLVVVGCCWLSCWLLKFRLLFTNVNKVVERYIPKTNVGHVVELLLVVVEQPDCEHVVTGNHCGLLCVCYCVVVCCLAVVVVKLLCVVEVNHVCPASVTTTKTLCVVVCCCATLLCVASSVVV